ncbi:MAG: DUF1080 domain-containing protein [Acidobacteriota bacterium]
MTTQAPGNDDRSFLPPCRFRTTLSRATLRKEFPWLGSNLVPHLARTDLLLLALVIFSSGGAVAWAQDFPPSGHISDFRDPPLTAEEGWTVLFNGRDFKGWVPVLKTSDGQVKKFLEHEVGQQSTFSVRDGKIVTTGTPSGYLRSTEVFDNYVLHLEVRLLAPGNSGVLVHIQKDDVWPRSIECQLYHAHMGRIFPLNGASLDGGEMFHSAANPVGQWNTYEIYAEEGRLATVLNGQLVGLAANADPRLGYFCLQSEGVPAEFRDIKIRRHTPRHTLRPKPSP